MSNWAEPAGKTSGIVRPGRPRYIQGHTTHTTAPANIMKASVRVILKPGVLDPQGKAIGNALLSLGFAGIGEVRQGKLIEIDLAAADPVAAHGQVEAMCKELLANPVIEDYAIEITPSAAADPGPKSP
jgi:phosphoribosylformylglycinamidine synthase subunit PurS